MLVTINTDASYSHEHKIGAYAFWIVSNEGRISLSGALKDRIENASQAEVMCIINAIHVLGKQQWKGITSIIINTDSMNAIHLLGRNKVSIKKYSLYKWGYGLQEKFINVKHGAKLQNIPIEFRHVKAHTNVDMARNWVNDWCDQAAKSQLWKTINNQTGK